MHHPKTKGKRTNTPRRRAILLAVATAGIVITLAAWFNTRNDTDVSTTNEIAAYKKLDMLVVRIMTTANKDSLLVFNNDFDKALYKTETSSVSDSAIFLSMRRFKFELNDKLNGMRNILDSGRFERTGLSLIRACANRISELSAK